MATPEEIAEVVRKRRAAAAAPEEPRFFAEPTAQIEFSSYPAPTKRAFEFKTAQPGPLDLSLDVPFSESGTISRLPEGGGERIGRFLKPLDVIESPIARALGRLGVSGGEALGRVLNEIESPISRTIGRQFEGLDALGETIAGGLDTSLIPGLEGIPEQRQKAAESRRRLLTLLNPFTPRSRKEELRTEAAESSRERPGIQQFGFGFLADLALPGSIIPGLLRKGKSLVTVGRAVPKVSRAAIEAARAPAVRRGLPEGVTPGAVGPIEQYFGVAREADRLTAELAGVQARLEGFAGEAIVRPRWAAGLTNQELRAVAAQEGVNPFLPDWGDAIDSQVIREAKRGSFKLPDAETVTDVRFEEAAIKRELKQAEKDVVSLRAVPDGAEQGVAQFVEPGAIAENIIGLRPVQVGLTRWQKLTNLARDTIGKPFPTVRADARIAGAFRERDRVQPIIDSRANRLGPAMEHTVREVFDIDDAGRVQSLVGIDEAVSGAPTIQDIAARLPNYEPSLNAAQREAIETLRGEVTPYRRLLKEVGVEVPTRPDIIEGGFYLPRGRAALEGADEPIKIRAVSGVGGKKSFERPSVFNSQAEGIDAGYEYAPFADALTDFAKGAGVRATDEHVASFFRNLTDETGALLGQTPKARMLRQNPRVAGARQGLRLEVNRLRALLPRLERKTDEVLDQFLHSPEFDDIDDFREALDGIRVTRGQSAGETAAGIRQLLKGIKESVTELRPEYKQALRRAQQTPRDQGIIDLPGLQGRTFPDELARAANSVIREQAQTEGPGFLRAANELNRLYRGFRATADDSAIGIQGLLGWSSSQGASVEALKLNLRAWGRGGDKLLGKFLADFDQVTAQAGRAGSGEWAGVGLRIGGARTEFMLGGRGVTGALSRAPGIRQANRAFGFYGDALRLGWADAELRALAKQSGRSIEEIFASDDAARIAKSINGATGWSEGVAFGNLGDLVLFAPRFFRARIETIARGVGGLRPGASLDRRIARDSLARLFAYATVITVSVNEMLGEETDFRFIRNGRKNSNFMRIRAFGRDWSLLGSWDSVAGAMVMTGMGKPQDAVRSLGSGLTANLWDFMSGSTAVGERTRDNPEQVAERLLENFIPFSAQEIPQLLGKAAGGVQEGDALEVTGATTGIVSEMIGIKSSRLSPFERRNVARQSVMREMGVEGNFEDLRVTDPRRRTIEENPKVVAANETFTKQRRDRLSELQQFVDEGTKVRDEFDAAVDAVAEASGPGRLFRERLADEWDKRITLTDSIRERYEESLDFLKDTDPDKADKDLAFFEYRKLTQDPALQDPITEEFDFEERDRRLEGFVKKWGQPILDEIEEFNQRNDRPLMTELRADQEYLSTNYWRLLDVALEMNGQKANYEKYRQLKSRDKKEFLALNPDLERTLSIVRRARQHRRQFGDPDIERLLLKWEYISEPVNPVVIEEERQRAFEKARQGELSGVR